MLSARQHGNVTRRQLLSLGLTDAGIALRIDRGHLYRVHWGVYAVGRRPNAPIERAAAAVLACGPGAALSHASALTLWGLAKHWHTPFNVTIAGKRRPADIRVHRSTVLVRRDVTRQLGIPVTSPARTLLDCAPALSDKALTRAVNDARLSGHLKLDALADVVTRFPRHRGARRVAPFAETPDGPTRSDWEDEFPAFCKRFGLPRPLMNAIVTGYEVDALFQAERVIVELDGWKFHSDRAAFERDRNRDADTLEAGFQTVRITWARMTDAPARDAARLRTILAARRGCAA